MQMDSRNTVEALRTLLSGLPNVIVSQAEIVLSTGVKIQIGSGHHAQCCDEQSSEPEPCPFCGGEAKVIKTPSDVVSWGAGCSNPCCIAYTGYGMKLFSKRHVAVAAWNRRAYAKQNGDKEGD